MKKVLLIFLLFFKIALGGSYTLSQEEKNLLDSKLETLVSQKRGIQLLDILNQTNSTVTGGWEDNNFRYSYKMLINENYRIAIFLMHTIYNSNNALVKMLSMQPDMMLVIDANSDKKLVWSGYGEDILDTIDNIYLPPEFPFY